ncbi:MULTISPECIES: hypothetical protein [Halorubrum]|nr:MULTISPECIES: hypothetical protein [Halorubrum]
MSNWDQSSEGEIEPHMRVYEDKVEFVDEDGDVETYRVGTQTTQARDRYERIQRELENGFLTDLIDRVTDVEADVEIDLDEDHQEIIDKIVDSITSERGRAIAGLSAMQLAIKSIAPEQSIRLHKGSKSSAHFSWEEGLSMRSIDSTYISPVLREYDLLRVNKDGVMMTRSLAENYPYSRFYQANIRGAQDAWADLIETLEDPDSGIDPEEALKYMITALSGRGERAEEINEATLELVSDLSERNPEREMVKGIIKSHINTSPHSARIYEVALHSLYQLMEEANLLDGELKELTQMRSADKKHGNVADIEVVDPSDEFHIYSAWDAKHGKSYLRNELQEIRGKLSNHPETQTVGFITSSEPERDSQLEQQKSKIEEEFDVEIELVTFDEFCDRTLDDLSTKMVSPSAWLTAYAETLCHRRRDRAPIDEPTQEWVSDLGDIVEQRA